MSHSNEQHRTSARKYIHIFQEWRFRIGSVILCLLFFQSIFSLAGLEAATYRSITSPVVALPFYPDAISMAFVISRIIKYYVTIIFIQLSVLGLIANYCYWVSRDSANCSISLNDFFSLVDALNPVWKSPRAHDMMNIKTILLEISQSPPFHGKNRAHLFFRHLQTNALVFFSHFYFSATRNSVYNRLVHARNSFKHLVFMWARNKRLKSETFRIKRDPNSTWQIIKCTYWKHDCVWQSWNDMKHWLNIIRWGAIWKLSTIKHVRKRKCA